jgi:AcrR family transcriptional regulator
MSERPYTQQMRKVASGLTRMATVRAAIEIIGSTSAAKFSMDAVASGAGISRMTVFNVFGDKRTLLVAVYDELASSGQLDDVTDILNDPDVDAAWARYVQRFAQFYQCHAAVLRHLRGMAALDPDFDAVMRQRDARKDIGIAWLVQRHHRRSPVRPASAALQDIITQVSALMGFEVLDALTQRVGGEQALSMWQAMVDAVRCQTSIKKHLPAKRRA